MKLAAGVVAILLLPLFVVAFDPAPLSFIYGAALASIIGVAIVFCVVAFVLQPKTGPDEPLDERRSDRFQGAIVLLLASTISAIALLLGTNALIIPVITCSAAIVWALIWLPAFDRRIGVTTQVAINRDPKTVFNFMLDGRNQMQYVPDLVSVDKITGGAIGPGTQFRSRVRMGETGTFEGVEEIVEVDWGQKIVDRVANGRLPNRGIMTFAPAPGGTLMTYRFESVVSYPSALLGQAAMRWALTGEMRRRRLVLWARLKQVLESQPAS